MAQLGSPECRRLLTSIEEPARTRVARRRSSLQHLLDGGILRAVANEHAECPHPLETSRAIATMCTSLPQWFDVDGAMPAEAVAHEYANLALRMIGADPTQS